MQIPIPPITIGATRLFFLDTFQNPLAGRHMTQSSTVLITGGAGYIGSHAVLALLDAGWRPVVIDDLSTGWRRLVPDGVPFVEGDVADTRLVEATLREHGCQAVMHFAGSIVVPESVADPLKYYRNNTAASRNLIEACVGTGIESFIFSSTAAVYGEPDRVPVSEDAPTRPASPYGASKLMTEWMLRDTAAATPLRYTALRYFNVAGADPEGRSGQPLEDASHLIKVACQAAVGLRDDMAVFGDDYDTPDGTCVRDFIHVSDLAIAHVAALDRLVGGGDSLVLNCGYGHGFSVRQVLDVLGDIIGGPITVRNAPRRPGDVSELISDSRRIRDILGWHPRYDDLATIVRTALEWEKRLLAMKRGCG